jgi:mycothiol synthase
VRTFEHGHDDAGWLRVNNIAFAGHPDQGDWTPETLEARMAEPWFDPSLFLLAVDADGIAGFNWLKRHGAREPDPELGEIYVIGVHPRTQGSGLGRALAVAGLALLHERGVGIGMLFVAADNAGALALYRSLGFEIHRTDRAYAMAVEQIDEAGPR